MIKLNIDFDEISEGIENASVDKHYIIDTKEGKIIYINDAIETNAAEKLEEIDNDETGKYRDIPAKLPEDNFRSMELFVYSLGEEEVKLSEKFHNALKNKKPFHNFKRLLEDYPEIRQRWFKFKEREIKNETINWLEANDIKLENQEGMDKVEIIELKENKLNDIMPEDFKDFQPTECLNCHNTERLNARIFSVNLAAENAFIEKEIKRIMKDQYNIESYGNLGGGKQELLTAASCPKCNSQDVMWDF